MQDSTRNRRNYCWPEPESVAKAMQGARTCNHPDCVNPQHVIPAIEMEWLDVSYRTKEKLSYQEIYKKIIAESYASNA